MNKKPLQKAIHQTGKTLRGISDYNPITLHRKGTRTKAIFALAAICFLWGTTWIASRQGVQHMPALQLAGMRQLLGGIIYLIFFLAKGAALPRKEHLMPLVVMAFLNFVLSNGLSTWGVKYISAGLGSIIGAIFPLWLVVISFFTASDKLPIRSVIGLLLGFAGVCIIFYEHLDDFLQADFRLGIFLSIAATWSWALGTLYTKKHTRTFNPYFGLGFQMTLAGIMLLIISRLDGSFIPFHQIPKISWLAIGYLVVFGSVLAFVAYLYALQHLPTEQASIYAYINPIVALLFGAWLFDEKLTLILAIGGVVTLYGVYLVNTAYRKSKDLLPPGTEN